MTTPAHGTSSQSDAAEKLRPVLDQAEESLGRHLDAACEATPKDLHAESTEDLLKLEDELLAAVRAVERTVTVRRVIEFSACPEEEAVPGAASGEPAPCLVREFADAGGRPWRVWQVIPGRGRAGAHGDRFLGDFSAGWLAFEALDDGERRRLKGNDASWAKMSDAELTGLLGRSTVVSQRRTLTRSGEDAADSNGGAARVAGG